jgi:hypothetical protein
MSLFFKFAIVWIVACAVLTVILWRSAKRHHNRHHHLFLQSNDWEDLR